jgi:hypothetical protein
MNRLPAGRARYVIVAAIVIGWLAVAVVVALGTAGGVVWF